MNKYPNYYIKQYQVVLIVKKKIKAGLGDRVMERTCRGKD